MIKFCVSLCLCSRDTVYGGSSVCVCVSSVSWVSDYHVPTQTVTFH